MIGEVAANEIGGAYREAGKDGVDPAEYVAHKIAHAVLGCGTGAIAGGGCTSGAVGGAVGEIVGGVYARYEAIQEFTGDLDALFRSEKGLTHAEADQLAANWKARGVDMAQLAGALAAFVMGKDVNTAATAAENAAKNNAIPLLIVLAPYAEAAAIYGLGVLTAFVVCRYSGSCVLPTDSTSTPPDDAVYSEDGEDIEQNNAGNDGGSSNGGSPNNNDDQKPNPPLAVKSVDDLIKSSKNITAKRGATPNYGRQGGAKQMQNDFDALGLENVTIKEEGLRVGYLKDGRTVIARMNSRSGRPTLEVQGGKRTIKIRY